MDPSFSYRRTLPCQRSLLHRKARHRQRGSNGHMLPRLGVVALMTTSRKASRRVRRTTSPPKARAVCLLHQKLVDRLVDRQRAARLCRASLRCLLQRQRRLQTEAQKRHDVLRLLTTARLALNVESGKVRCTTYLIDLVRVKRKSFEELFAEAADSPVLLLYLLGCLVGVVVFDERVRSCLCLWSLHAVVLAPTDPFKGGDLW